MMVHDVHAGRQPPLDWLAKSDWAIARGEAILAGSADPIVAPKPTHVLARLDEECVRSAIASVLDVDDSFGSVSPDLVTDEDVRSACETVAETADLSDAVSNAEFLTAMEATRAAHRRLQPG